MAFEEKKIMSERKKHLLGSFSKTVTDYLLYNKNLTQDQKNEVLNIARGIAFRNGHIRVYWEDFQKAMREWDKKRMEAEKNAV